uniref:Piwi domain-containing protein n=1 Tax=Haemonchus contortus TaxID=6289 RepID=A0A7I4XZM4_HAECO
MKRGSNRGPKDSPGFRPNNRGRGRPRESRRTNNSQRYPNDVDRSMYFLPRHLQEANPWETVGPDSVADRDVACSDRSPQAYEDRPSDYRNCDRCNDFRNTDRSTGYRNTRHRRNSREEDEYETNESFRRDDYRDSDRRSGRQYHNERGDSYDMCDNCRFGAWPRCSCARNSPNARGNRDHRGRESAAQWYEKSTKCDCGRPYNMESEDDRCSCRSRDCPSPRRLTREEWRRLEREEYEREQHMSDYPPRSGRYDNRRPPFEHRSGRDDYNYDNRENNRRPRFGQRIKSEWRAEDDGPPRDSCSPSDRRYFSDSRNRTENTNNFNGGRENPRYGQNKRRNGNRDNRKFERGGNRGFGSPRNGSGSVRSSEFDQWSQGGRADREHNISNEMEKLNIRDASPSREKKKAQARSEGPSAVADDSKNSETESEGEKPRLSAESGCDSSPSKPSVVEPSDVGVILAPKKEPASRANKERVRLLTNFWEVNVQSKMVYRYDLAVYLGTPTNEKAVDCLRGERDDSAVVARRKLCLQALHHALQWYGILSKGEAVIHDGASMMFSSEDLAHALKEHNGVLKLDIPKELRALIRRVDVSTLTIEITPCREAAASFDIADLSAQKNRNWAILDRSWKQFYELLTSQDATIGGQFTQFGAGCLYSPDPCENVGYGFQRLHGARKGIKFIEGRRDQPNGVVAAMILDHRVGLFYRSQSLMTSVREIDGLQNVASFDFSFTCSTNKDRKRMNRKWVEVNEYVRGVRMIYTGTASNPVSFVAAGITDEPIKKLKNVLPNNAKTEVSVLAKFADTKVAINPNWPAVKWRVRGREEYFPMELLQVEPNQRVPLEKQAHAKSAKKADKPDVRLQSIYNLLEALNLHDNASRNKFLRAFGVSISYFPKSVEGFRRQAPQITYGGNHPCAVDKAKYNWRESWDTKYVKGGKVDRIIVVHNDKYMEKNVRDPLQKLFKNRGVQCGDMTFIFLDFRSDFEMEDRLVEVFEEAKNSNKSSLIIFIDRAESKSHEFLKLMERRYLIPTQQLTSELASRLSRQPQSCANFVLKTNLKLGGINYEVIPESFAANVWISRGETLIVGYDVAHPGRPTRDEIMNKMPPMKPSVVGFSFNGAVHREMFIGDYHFQIPRREKVEHSVLNARFKWMLELFLKNRGVWPEHVIITRDGVSEGQYRMVIDEELFAIKEACEEFGNIRGRDSWMPRFTVIVATKRHNARFFVEKRGIENPLPATVVDTDVVRNDITEFYIQSHRPVQGTAKPTAYQVLVDDNDMSMDGVQSLMLALTFHHQISGAPVSLPEPVYQADEWAKRGKNVFNAFMERYNPPLKKERGEYAALPIDFEEMTNKLAFWHTELEDRRVNA